MVSKEYWANLSDEEKNVLNQAMNILKSRGI